METNTNVKDTDVGHAVHRHRMVVVRYMYIVAWLVSMDL